MTLKTNANRQTSNNFSCSEQPFTVRTRILVPRLRRPAHSPEDLLADAILLPAGGDVNLNLGTWANDFAGVTPGVNATGAILASGVAILAEASCLNEVRIAAAVDEDDEDEDEDADYDDDDLDEEDDEDLDDEDDEGFEDDLDDEDDDLDDDDLDDEDEDDEDE
jgi:hypothetical protein